MTHEQVFLRAILDDPADDTARLAYADWLEEQGDPRAEALRAYPDIGRLLAGLQTATRAPFDELERQASAGRMDFLSGLAVTLERGRDLIQNRKWPGIVSVTRDHLRFLLALTPGLASAEGLLRVLAERPDDTAMPAAASVLASGQTPSVLLTLLARHGADRRLAELLACLVQEMVLRGVILDGQPSVEELREGHPLAALPLHLTGIEQGLGHYLPSYETRTINFQRTQAPRAAARPLPSGLGASPAVFSDVTDEAARSDIGAAVRNWQEKSNGLVEARVLRASRPLTEDDLTLGLLTALGLEPLQGAVSAGCVPPSEAACALFSAACNGGAYSDGHRGAYGRLQMWRSMAGLAGAGRGEGIEALAALAERCLWVSFGASDWFYDLAWDVGLLALRPGGTSLAVLAATDTD
jgi:uncharacterized protein (TIGR02996 family)